MLSLKCRIQAQLNGGGRRGVAGQGINQVHQGVGPGRECAVKKRPKWVKDEIDSCITLYKSFNWLMSNQLKNML